MKNSTKSVQSRICSGFAKRRIKRSAAEGKANWGPTAKARILSLFTILMMALTAQAEEQEPVKYLRFGNQQDCTVYEVISGNISRDITLGLTSGEKWYVVDGDVETNYRITVIGTTHLILKDGASLKANNGITVYYSMGSYYGYILNIYAQSTGDDMGKLIATGEADHAGIGSPTSTDYGIKSGQVNIHGGNITAKGGSNAAGIGGSLHGTCDVCIFNGNITAKGGSNAPGIGNGHDSGTSVTGEISIYAGNITAEGGSNAAGIGSDNFAEHTLTGRLYEGTPNIYIGGGTVTAIGNGGGAGIGGGNGGVCGRIKINRGNVTARSDTGAAIGGGYGGDNNTEHWNYSGTIDITGGTVRAIVANEDNSGGAIGNGGGRSDTDGDATVTIYNSLKVASGTAITTADYVMNNTDCKDAFIFYLEGSGTLSDPYIIDTYDKLKIYAEYNDLKNPDH